jgi:hypothetical protein
MPSDRVLAAATLHSPAQPVCSITHNLEAGEMLPALKRAPVFFHPTSATIFCFIKPIFTKLSLSLIVQRTSGGDARQGQRIYLFRSAEDQS